uniref:Proteasomal ATPase second OB domain-containing protein n=1 Tax=Brassica campestris TaxID=3711 RepID=M4F4J6_BRACM
MLWLHRCRCFRFWDACNQKKKGDLIGFDMVLLDEKISIAGHRLKTFKNLFREGVLYELESRVRTARDNLRGSKKEFNITEDDLKSLQSVAQIIGEVLRPLDNERLIVKASSGPRYVVGCRSKVDKEKLISGTRFVLDMTTLTIMRALPREAFTQNLSINMGDAEEVSQHYRLMSRHTRDCLGVSFRCYAHIPVSGQECVQLSNCLIETLNKDEVY